MIRPHEDELKIS